MKSFNKSQHDWEQRHASHKVRTVTPVLLQQLYGPTEDERRDRALEETYLRLFGKVPQDDNERYAAAEAVEHQPCINGRGED